MLPVFTQIWLSDILSPCRATAPSVVTTHFAPGNTVEQNFPGRYPCGMANEQCPTTDFE